LLSVILPERLKSQWVLDLMVRFARPTLFNHTFERATDTIDQSARAGSPPASWPGLAALLLHRLPLALLMLKWVAPGHTEL